MCSIIKPEMKYAVGLCISLSLFFLACQSRTDALFTKLDPVQSGIIFENTVEESPQINILSYEYTYNGGGVAAGDFNNDGLCDLYFSGNAVSNRLYVNEGNLKFRDVTTSSGTPGRDRWKTGVTATDVNGDGWLDLYVCYSGPDSSFNLSNQLFINNGVSGGGDPTFTESAAEYGLDARGTFSTQASFFDYDKDGDLDMFLLNHGNHFYSPFTNTNALRTTRHPQFGNRLYRNDRIAAEGSGVKTGNHFTEVSDQAGIHGGGINFGLGVSVSDVNNDGWPDLFVTNDYEEQDFLYINNGDGTFRDATSKSFGHFSRNGMGTDIADFNNDGHADLIEVDMWPEDNFRQKLLKGPDDYHRYNLMLDSGFHHQQMRNTLQMNAGNDLQGNPVFCEIGQLAGISSTDWSWAPLFADVDNDGFKDLFVTNGYLRDFTSMDFLKYTVEEERKKSRTSGKELNLYELVSKMPSTKTRDYIFANNGDLTFSDRTAEWGIDVPNLSFGAAYADLDNDGDLELIINNTNESATVWLNNARKVNQNNFIQVEFEGPLSNPHGIGAKVIVSSGDMVQTSEQFLTRGFQSSVDPVLHFGLGKNSTAAIQVFWKEGGVTRLEAKSVNNRVKVSFAAATPLQQIPAKEGELFTDVTNASGADFTHRENTYHDFDHEALLPAMYSRIGPSLATADVNGDGNDDFFVGGAAGQSGELFLSDAQGRFRSVPGPWHSDAGMEDTGVVFLDADGDLDQDLFVVSGGNENKLGSLTLDDRLYINSGNGRYVKAPADAIVADHSNGTCVAAADFDKDGDIDLFVGGGVQPGNFPYASPGAILRNESKPGNVKFVVATKEVGEALRKPGLVSDAVWSDFDADGWTDLIIVGEWMPVKVFKNVSGRLVEVAAEQLKHSSGLWKTIEPADFDGDGDIDYILGNAGENLPWRVSADAPLDLYYADFNGDGKTDPVITAYLGGKSYPIASRDELLFQVSSLRKKFTTYAAYGEASIENILSEDELSKAERLNVHTLASSILINHGRDSFELRRLPVEAQFSAVTGILSGDFTGDGHMDILAAGNFYSYLSQFGPSDAGMGILLSGNGKGKYSVVPRRESGLMLGGDIRSLAVVGTPEKKFIVAARNDEKLSVIESNRGRPGAIAKSNP